MAKSKTKQAEAKPSVKYYHFAPQRLGPGSVVQPGNYGRFLRRYQGVPQGQQQAFGNPWVLARELQFELVRMRHHSNKPSRFECAFCLPSIEEAEQYRAQFDGARIQVLHEVELVDPTRAMHVTWMQYVDFPGINLTFLEATEMRAGAYWSGLQAGQAREVLTLSALRITSNID